MFDMWMVSDRSQFFNPDTISEMTQMAYVDANGHLSEQNPKIESLKNKSVLVLIHGFNNDESDTLTTYHEAKKHIDQKMAASGKKIYDHVIGYLWPGCDSRTEYYEARGNADEVSGRLKDLMTHLKQHAERVDVMAHSMGNRVFLDALESPNTLPKMVDHFFSLAPAVNDESIERNQIYESAIRKCNQAYICYSKQDEVLQFLYSIAEMSGALGFDGAENLSLVSKNVQFVDCTDVIGDHSGYWNSPQIYDFIEMKVLEKESVGHSAQSVRLETDSKVKVIPPKNHSGWSKGAKLGVVTLGCSLVVTIIAATLR